MELQAAFEHLRRTAIALGDGDPDAGMEASALLAGLIDDAESDTEGGAPERLLRFLVSVAGPGSPDAAQFQSLLGATVLEVTPRLLALGAASPGAAAAAGQLTELMARMAGAALGPGTGQGTGSPAAAPALGPAGASPVSCSGRELLTALLELLDLQSGPAFESGSPLAPLLLRLVELLPPLVAALQRRRLQVAMSTLPAVADAAAAAGRRLTAVVAATEVARAEAEAHAVAAAQRAMPAEVTSAAAAAQAAEEAEEVAGRAEAALVVPFVEFAEELHRRVLLSELPPPPSTTAAAPGAGPGPAPPAAQLREADRLVACWLLALMGALGAAWPEREWRGPARGGVSGGAGAGPLSPLVSLLGRYQGGGAWPIGWEALWAAAGAAAKDEELEVCPDPELPRCGAALLLWADCCGDGGVGGSGDDRGPGVVLEAPADPRAALQVLLEAALTLMAAAGREGSGQLLRRGLQLLAAGGARIRAAERNLVPVSESPSDTGPGPDAEPWVVAAARCVSVCPDGDPDGAGTAAAAFTSASALCEALVAPPFAPRLDERDAELAALGRRLAVAAGLQMAAAGGAGGPMVAAREEEARARAHGALQVGVRAPVVRAPGTSGMPCDS
ncbi:hypothetical protein GPECTOR_29g15 [Gonium pectorale]|uniref:Uncharacterized protein n=1 Tax=Gonium pectorale TaxID=33097 RepID=A0A150GEH7_GONPE|nr:hypothetical protein GPECTOR_29g15 [Gonium pectorale]|eukprot:KXZ48234.1 hypothetical protein GPECTOR_29g15 [Gonium pectorale]